MTSKLTLNFGLLWERDGSWKEKYDRWAYFDFAAGEVVYPKTASIDFTSFPYPACFDDRDGMTNPTK